MKATKTILAMLFAAAFMTFAACSKDNNDPEPQPVHYYDLSGTTWESQMANTFSYMGIVEIDLDLFASLDFFSDTSGESYYDLTMAGENQNYTEQFTYKFDGTALTLYTVHNDTTMTEDIYLYDRTNNTFWQEVPDEVIEGTPINIRDLYGSDRIVFHLVRGTFSL